MLAAFTPARRPSNPWGEQYQQQFNHFENIFGFQFHLQWHLHHRQHSTHLFWPWKNATIKPLLQRLCRLMMKTAAPVSFNDALNADDHKSDHGKTSSTAHNCAWRNQDITLMFHRIQCTKIVGMYYKRTYASCPREFPWWSSDGLCGGGQCWTEMWQLLFWSISSASLSNSNWFCLSWL